jgi:predicted ester cyclase
VTNAIASGNTVAQEITWEGTQSGPLQGPGGTIPATGKRAVVPAVQVLTFEGDKIKETRHYFDMMGMLQQLGVGPR